MQRKNSLVFPSLLGSSKLEPIHTGPPPSPGGSRLFPHSSFNEIPNTPLSPRQLPRSNTFEEIRKAEKENKEKLDKAKRSLEERLQQLERREYELVQDANRSKHETNHLKRQLEQLKRDHARLQGDFDTVNRERGRFLQECNSLREDVEDMNKYKGLEEDAERLKKKVAEMEKLILSMRKVIDDIEKENRELKEREKLSKHEIDKLKYENHDLRRQESTKERKLDELRHENRGLKEQLGDNSKDQTINQLKHNLSNEHNRNKDLLEDISQLEENLAIEHQENEYLVGEVKEFKLCLANEQKRSQSLVNEIDGLREILGTERNQKERLADELDEVKQTLSTEKTRHQHLVGEFNAFKQNLAEENHNLVDDLDDARHALSAEQGRNQSLVNELNGVKRALSTEQALTQKLIKDVDQLERSLTSEKQKNRRLSEEAGHIGETNRSLTDELNQLKSKLNSAEMSRDQYRNRLSDAEHRLEMLEMARRAQQTPPPSIPGSTQTINLQPGSQIHHGLLSPNTPTQHSYDLLPPPYGAPNNNPYGRSPPPSPPQSPGHHNNLGRLKDEKEARLQQEKQIEKLRNEHNLTKEDLARVESERKKLLEQNRILEADKSVCEQKLQESQTALSDLTVRCKGYEENSLKQRNLIESLTRDLEDLDNSSNDGDAIMRQLEKTRTELRNANTDLEMLRKDLDAAMTERDHWEKAYSQLEEENTENRKRLAELTEQNSELSEQNSELSGRTSDLESTVETYTAAENAATLMRIEKAALELKSLHVAFENLQIENTDLAARLKDESAEKEELLLKIESLESSYQESGKLESAGMLEKLAKVGFELQKLRQRFEELEVQNCQLAAQLKEETVGKQNYQQQLQSLEGSYQALLEKSKKTEDDLDDKLHQCERYIHELEMERVILEEDLAKAEKAHSDLGRICTGYEDEAAKATDQLNQTDKDKTYWEDQYIALKEAHDELLEVHAEQTKKLELEGKQLGELAIANHNMGDELEFTKRKWEELKVQQAETELALADSEERLLRTIGELNQQSAESRQEITRRENEAEQLRNTIGRLNKEGLDMRKDIHRLRTGIDERDSAIQIRDTTIGRYVALMNEKDRQIAKEKGTVSLLEHDILDWERRHALAKSEKLKVQAEYQSLRSKFDRQDGMITALGKEKEKLEKKLERHADQVAEKDAALREARKARDHAKERLEVYKEQRDTCAKLMRKLNDKVNYKKKDPVPYLFWLLNSKDAVESREARAWNCVVKKAAGFKFRSYRVYA